MGSESETFSEARRGSSKGSIAEGFGSWKAAIRELSTKKTLLSLLLSLAIRREPYCSG